MNVFVFPGQAAQFVGMGKELYESSGAAKSIMDEANSLLGFDLTKVMFEGDEDSLKETHITQPAVFLHSVASFKSRDGLMPDAVAGHSLGEFSALVASGALSFEDGMRLVQKRANAMQKACEAEPSTMAAIVGLDDNVVEEACSHVDGVVVPANYNCPGQLVISGSVAAIDEAIELLKEKGARRAIKLAVGGAFHSPLMSMAEKELEEAINGTTFEQPKCPIYQNVDALPHTAPEEIKANLISQLTSPVRWTQIMQRLISDGMKKYVEVGGNGKVLTGMLRRLDRTIETDRI